MIPDHLYEKAWERAADPFDQILFDPDISLEILAFRIDMDSRPYVEMRLHDSAVRMPTVSLHGFKSFLC